MPLTDAEFAFLNAYVDEVYSPAMTGPHSQALRKLGVSQWDLSWLLTAHHHQALAVGQTPLGSHRQPPAPLPWSSKNEVLSRGGELHAELEHLDEAAQSLPG